MPSTLYPPDDDDDDEEENRWLTCARRERIPAHGPSARGIIVLEALPEEPPYRSFSSFARSSRSRSPAAVLLIARPRAFPSPFARAALELFTRRPTLFSLSFSQLRVFLFGPAGQRGRRANIICISISRFSRQWGELLLDLEKFAAALGDCFSSERASVRE